MSPLLSGLALAVLASVALNASYLLQHAGSRDAPELRARRPLASLRSLFGSHWWLAGLVAGGAGWALYVAALARAPLSLVQAFAAGGLALTVPAAARAFGQRLDRAELGAIGVLVVALALLGLGASAQALAAVPAGSLGLALGVTAAAAVAVAGSRHARALGLAGGMLYGAADAATKAVTVDAHGHLGTALSSPWLTAVIVTSIGAFACFQRGLQIGPAVPVIALMTAATNAVAILIGVLAFGEPLGATPACSLLHSGAFALAGAAGLRLAAGQGRRAARADPGSVAQRRHELAAAVLARSFHARWRTALPARRPGENELDRERRAYW